jgi:hypothetical protein
MGANAIQTGNIQDAQVTLAKVEAIPAAKIIVGNASNRPEAVTVSGDLSLSNSGAATITAGAVDNAKIADGSIQNGKLVSSSVTISGGDGVPSLHLVSRSMMLE